MPLSEPALNLPALRGTDLPLQRLTLLAVEDSRLTCEVLRLMCQRSGARLRRADGVAAARAHLRRYRPDVVLIDLGLPDGRGEDLMADLAAQPGRPPIIGMSGMGHDRLPAGADAFVQKPLPGLADFQALVLALRQGRAILPAMTGTAQPPPPDPLALQDDLRQAAQMLGQRDGRFVAGFVLGLARSSDDPALASAATDLGPQGQGMARLRQMIASRLSAMGDGVVPPQPGVQAP